MQCLLQISFFNNRSFRSFRGRFSAICLKHISNLVKIQRIIHVSQSLTPKQAECWKHNFGFLKYFINLNLNFNRSQSCSESLRSLGLITICLSQLMGNNWNMLQMADANQINAPIKSTCTHSSEGFCYSSVKTFF